MADPKRVAARWLKKAVRLFGREKEMRSAVPGLAYAVSRDKYRDTTSIRIVHTDSNQTIYNFVSRFPWMKVAELQTILAKIDTKLKGGGWERSVEDLVAEQTKMRSRLRTLEPVLTPYLKR